MSKVWFVTGAGRGLGREFVEAALERGDQVAATARDNAALADLASRFSSLQVIALDVTQRDACFAAIEQAHARFGRLDVVVNNAGYGLFGSVEEITAGQLQRQLDVNLFGVLHVTQAALPVLRAQGAGHIVQISTVGGVAAFPLLGGYHASKWALEGLSESIAQEVAPFGIKVTLVEPGPFGTDWAGSSAVHAAPQPQYDPLREARAAQGLHMPKSLIGEPGAAARALLKLVDAEAPPLRAFFGTLPTMIAPQIYKDRLATWEAWKSLAIEANGHPGG